ncbi:MAG: HNH endonuclease [Bacteriovoracaceae bacterium]|nr:HNH endonuclease [Bacteriovoracaceae bacterium]
MNKWGIPIVIEILVRERDKECVYCHTPFSISERKRKASWEHIINDIRITSADNIALCCVSCNASKGNKPLAVWLGSKYCASKNINANTVAQIVKDHLRKYSP